MKDRLVNKLKSYGFWMSLASAVFVFLNTLGMKVDIPYLTQITTAFLGILAVAGIITKSGGSGGASGNEVVKENISEDSEMPKSIAKA